MEDLTPEELAAIEEIEAAAAITFAPPDYHRTDGICPMCFRPIEPDAIDHPFCSFTCEQNALEMFGFDRQDFIDEQQRRFDRLTPAEIDLSPYHR
jgi:endogenous inhibitor of DNA gyrase (YacG/DUF329 family)